MADTIQNLQATERLKALATLNASDPDVSTFLTLAKSKLAKPEENLKEIFLRPFLVALGHKPTSEFHLSEGDADYMLRTGDDETAMIAVEVKKPALRFPDALPQYSNKLATHLIEKRKYLQDSRVRWLLLTDGISWMFYDKKELTRGDRPVLEFTAQRLTSEAGVDWFFQRLSPDRIADTLVRSAQERDKLGLVDRFYTALSHWIEALAETNEGVDHAGAVALINKLIFARTLEDLGCVPFRHLATGLGDAERREKPARAAEKFLASVNEWFFDYYDTELFKSEPLKANLAGLRCVLFGAPMRGNLVPDDLYSFDFSRLDVDVLGHVYERYLAGYRKEKGIYYTRTEVVAGIVDRVISPLVHPIVLEALTLLDAGDRSGSVECMTRKFLRLRIIDPACGSGSFLICAYDRIMRAYREWETAFNDPGRRKHDTGGLLGHVGLPKDMDKRILVSCIYGVDLDPGAIAVAKLNLWLAMVKSNPERYDWVILKRMDTNYVLPPLRSNIFCANSLTGHPPGAFAENQFVRERMIAIRNLREGVGRDFLLNRDAVDFQIPDKIAEAIAHLRANAGRVPSPDFLHEVAFGFAAFDAVIGNPPYVGEEDHKDIFREVCEWPLLAPSYEGKMDYAYFFLHLAKLLLKAEGRLAFILPIYFEKAEGGRKLNRMLATEMRLDELFFFGDVKVFAESAPGQHNVVLIATKAADPEARPHIARVRNPSDEAAVWRAYTGEDNPCTARYLAPAHRDLLDGRDGLRLAPAGAEEICARIDLLTTRLANRLEINTGIQAGPNDLSRKAFSRLVETQSGHSGEATDQEISDLSSALHIDIGAGVFVLSTQEGLALDLSEREKELLHPFHPAADISAFSANLESEQLIIYATSETCPDVAKFPRVEKHLRRFRPIMELRRETMDGNRAWFQLHWPRDAAIFQKPKLVGPRQTPMPCYAFVAGDYYVDLACEVLTLKEEAANPESTLLAWSAVLNSAPVYFWLYHRGKRKGEMLQLDRGPLDSLPVPDLTVELRDVLADHAKRLGALTALLRDSPRWVQAVGRNGANQTAASLIRSGWTDPISRRDVGDPASNGTVRISWQGTTVQLTQATLWSRPCSPIRRARAGHNWYWRRRSPG